MSDPKRERKGEPFSIRLTQPTDRFVSAEARRTRRSKSAVVEMLTEEAARIRRFPGIAFRGDDASRRAWVIGTGLDVWQIIEALEQTGGTDELARSTDLNERQIRLAIAYRDHYPDEITRAIADNAIPLDELRELYPPVPVEPVD